MKAQHGRSSPAAPAAASTFLVAGMDSPVRTASSHSSPWASRRRTSAGTRSPTRSATTSPGTRSVTSTSTGWPSRPHQGPAPDLVVQGGHRHLGPVLVEEPEGDAEADDHRDDHSVGGVAGQSRDPGAQEQQQDEGVADLTHQDGGGPDAVEPHHVGPHAGQPVGRVGAGQAPVGAVQLPEDVLGCAPGRRDHVERSGGGRRGGDDGGHGGRPRIRRCRGWSRWPPGRRACARRGRLRRPRRCRG